MFQQVFKLQSETLLLWPMVGLFLFITVFVLKTIHALRLSTQRVAHDAHLPLGHDDGPIPGGQSEIHHG